ncbi:carbohydrate ABC transporter permease [Nocardioides rubriscoriae]|uniref:carbohydrate ABC transporter permease n=1 Tax=Nocardioides rubriscoriae TaxID=642762 RepID=UPI0011DF7DAF|nr:sugar ABC transporter permease [Nocardioides rubriscoriae]
MAQTIPIRTAEDPVLDDEGGGTGTRRRRRRTPGRGSTPASAPWLFLLPFGLPFLLFYVAPVAYALWRSLFKIERTGGIYGKPTEVFAGLDQYRLVFQNDDFISSVLRVLGFGLVQIPIMLLLALGLALLLDSTVARFKALFRISFFVPYAIPGVVGALIWGFIYSPGLSPIVDLLGKAGLEPEFLSARWILWSIANVVTWTYTGYNMLIIYSALQAIPQEIYEAAKMDGASNWRIARHVKIPSVAPALVLTGVFSIIGTLQLFTEPIVFSKIATTITTTYTPNMVVLSAGQNNYNYAAAISVTLALSTFVLSFAFLKITQRKAEM